MHGPINIRLTAGSLSDWVTRCKILELNHSIVTSKVLGINIWIWRTLNYEILYGTTKIVNTYQLSEQRVLWKAALLWLKYQPYNWSISHTFQVSAIRFKYQSYDWRVSHVNELSAIKLKYQPYSWSISYTTEVSAIWFKYQSHDWSVNHMNELSAI